MPDAEVRTLIHLTPARALPAILREGLIPVVGPRARLLGEPAPAIYLFPDRATAEEALGGWFGDCFAEDEPIAILAVRVPTDVVTSDEHAGFELRATSPIPPAAISVLAIDG